MSGEEPPKKKQRVARKQATEDDVFTERPHTGEYNIWYDRVHDYSTFKERREMKLAGKRFRINVDKDCGKTKARRGAYICLHFARGKCINGGDCKYYHRLPGKEDEESLDQVHDIFGRERHSTERPDMGGVGSFSKMNRSLYLGGIRCVNNVEELLYKEFSKYGELTYLKVIRGMSIAFISYRYRVCAEFAKEAMADQGVVSNEAINVRWANDDPNPNATRQKEDALVKQAWARMRQVYPSYFSQYEAVHAEGVYPDTNNQYQQNQQLGTVQGQLSSSPQQQQLQYQQEQSSSGNYDGPPSSHQDQTISTGIPDAHVENQTRASAMGGAEWRHDEKGGYFYWINEDEREEAVQKLQARMQDQMKKEQETYMAYVHHLKEVEEAVTVARANQDAGGSEDQVSAPAEANVSTGEGNNTQGMTVLEQTYAAWQSYYAANGYPYFYHTDGTLHYYDPAVYTPTPEQLQTVGGATDVLGNSSVEYSKNIVQIHSCASATSGNAVGGVGAGTGTGEYSLTSYAQPGAVVGSETGNDQPLY